MTVRGFISGQAGYHPTKRLAAGHLAAPGGHLAVTQFRADDWKLKDIFWGKWREIWEIWNLGESWATLKICW